MTAQLREAERVRDLWCAEFKEQRDDANALVKHCAALELENRALRERLRAAGLPA